MSHSGQGPESEAFLGSVGVMAETPAYLLNSLRRPVNRSIIEWSSERGQNDVSFSLSPSVPSSTSDDHRRQGYHTAANPNEMEICFAEVSKRAGLGIPLKYCP